MSARTSRRYAYIVVMLMIGLVLATVHARRQSRANSDRNEIGFPFTLKEEARLVTGFGSRWSIRVIITKDYYSKENLDRLFRFYSRKHPSKGEKLDVAVYTDEKNWQRELTDIAGWIQPGIPSKKPQPESKSRLNFWDARFSRDGDGVLSYIGDNESYTYSPDPYNPNETRIVILKGTIPSRSRNVLETWQTLDSVIKIRVMAYSLSGVEPSGIYYTFESPEPESNLWRSIMTFRQDQRIPIPRDQVRIVNAQIGYVFMGFMYAVTTDGGRTWSAWDAETDLPNFEPNTEFIQDVSVAEDGLGVMKLKKALHTKDYGRHWSLE